MKTYKHSGAMGDLIYSLALVKELGGGEFYLHLDQLNWIGKHYYGSAPNPVHQNRLSDNDYKFMYNFMTSLPYISKFDILDKTTEITHNLDRFRVPFVGHPGNYVDIYAEVMGINSAADRTRIRNSPWLSVPEPKIIEGRHIVVNRTERWLPNSISTQWSEWKQQGLDEYAVFVGHEHEFKLFLDATGWDACGYCPTQSLTDLAATIAGAQMFIGNQSLSLSLAIGLGVEFWCEARQDLPLSRNECYFPDHPKGHYF